MRLYTTLILGLSVIISGNSFIHISDLHYDPLFAENTPDNCIIHPVAICCRNTSIAKNPFRLVNKWGSYMCDSSPSLIQESIRWISINFGDSDFILLSGDLTPHNPLAGWQENFKAIQRVTEWLMDTGIPVIPAIGNHDSGILDQFYGVIAEEVLNDLSRIWKRWLEGSDIFDQTGYYVIDRGILRVIVLNSLLDDCNNLLNVDDHSDPYRRWQWLRSVLDQSRAESRVVWILGHIASGAAEATSNFTWTFQELVSDYADVITHTFFGHSHDAEFRLIRDPRTTPRVVTGLQLVSSSVMPDFHYPILRKYYYNPDNMEILDYQQFYLNLTEQFENLEFIGYTMEYTASELFGVENISIESFIQLSKRLKESPALLKTYCQHYQYGNPYMQCEDPLQLRSLYCEFTWNLPDDFKKCVDFSGVE